MTIPAFKAALCAKYPSFDKQDKGELADIEDFLKQYDEKAIGILWYNFRDDYDKGMIPRRSYFYRLADKLNLQKTAKPEYQKYEYVCYICASDEHKNATNQYRFPVEKWPCPRCGNTERPLFALCRNGAIITRQYAQSIVDNFPRGPWDQSLLSHSRSSVKGEFLPGNMKN